MCGLRLIFSFTFCAIFLQGCGASSSAQESSAQENSDPVPVRELEKGNQPLSGTQGRKMLTTIRSEVEFASLWFDYTNEDLPEIDFHSNVVVLYDRGFIDLNHCGSLASKMYLQNILTIQLFCLLQIY